MSLQKEKMTDFRITGNYWTIIRVELNFHPFPKINLDDDNNFIGFQNAPSSRLTLGLFVSKDDYDLQASGTLVSPLEIKEYDVPFMDALTSQRDISKTGENHAQDWIIANDPFFSDAEIVE